MLPHVSCLENLSSYQRLKLPVWLEEIKFSIADVKMSVKSTHTQTHGISQLSETVQHRRFSLRIGKSHQAETAKEPITLHFVNHRKCFGSSTYKRQSSFIRPALCLCWIPRHSPKVVKAASQVLSSMWQYRDLRSLYKKVKSLSL